MAYLLIVADDKDFAGAVAKVLRHSGYEVDVELDISGAITSKEKKCPDLVILDVMFCENASAGFDLARDMREQDGKLKDVPVLLLTAVNAEFPPVFGSKDIDDDMMPVFDFMEKPVDFDILKNKVFALLHKEHRQSFAKGYSVPRDFSKLSEI